MNANTILSFRSGTGRNQLAVSTGDWSTPVPILMNSDTGTAATMNQAILAIPSQSAIVGSFNPLDLNANGAILGPAFGRMFGTPRGVNAPYFNTSSFDGVPFRIRACGRCNMGANGGQSLIVTLVSGPAVTIGGAGNVTIATTGAAFATAAGGDTNFQMVCDVMWSSGVAHLSGIQRAVIAFAATEQHVAQATISNSPVALATLSLLQFQLFLTAGNAAASSLTSCEFSLEAI